jgi:hypothetical protein
MYSETAGLSYENPDVPDARGDQTDDDHVETELRRVAGLPDEPTPPDHTEAVASDQPPGDSDPDPEAVTPPMGFEALLGNSAGDADAAARAGAYAQADADDPRPDVPIAALPPADAAPPARPQLNLTTGSWPRQPSEKSAEAEWTRPFGSLGGSAPVGHGSQPGRQRIPDLVMDPRMRFWRERIVAMVIAGALFAVLWGWIAGLTVAIIVGITHAVLRSRTVGSLPPGVKLTRAQRITQRKLASLQRAGYRALNARPIPDSADVIDHLVVGPTGVYAIDSEKWNRKLPIRTRNGKQLWLGPTSQKPRLEHAKWEAGRASELLSARLGREIVVRPALAIYGPHIPWDIAVIRDVDVFNGDRLRKYLKRRSKVREAPRLSREDVAEIYEVAEAVLPFGLTAPNEAVLSGG